MLPQCLGSLHKMQYLFCTVCEMQRQGRSLTERDSSRRLGLNCLVHEQVWYLSCLSLTHSSSICHNISRRVWGGSESLPRDGDEDTRPQASVKVWCRCPRPARIRREDTAIQVPSTLPETARQGYSQGCLLVKTRWPRWRQEAFNLCHQRRASSA